MAPALFLIFPSPHLLHILDLHKLDLAAHFIVCNIQYVVRATRLCPVTLQPAQFPPCVSCIFSCPLPSHANLLCIVPILVYVAPKLRHIPLPSRPTLTVRSRLEALGLRFFNQSSGPVSRAADCVCNNQIHGSGHGALYTALNARCSRGQYALR